MDKRMWHPPSLSQSSVSEERISTMPSTQVVSPQFFRRNSTPHYCQQPGVNPGYIPAIRASRARTGTRTGVPFYRNNSFPMTVNNYTKVSKAKLSGNMDLFSPDFQFSPGGDHVLPAPDLQMYAASPNSLYLYEQERYDMQNLGNSTCFSNTRTQPKPDSVFPSGIEEFDLNPQFENNYELLNNVDDTPKNADFTNYRAQNSAGRNSNVTLTELNMGSESESFLDDLESVLPKHISYPSSVNNTVRSVNQNVFPNPSSQRQNLTYLSTATSGNFLNSAPLIKSEPTGTCQAWSKPCQQLSSLQQLTPFLQKSKTVSQSSNSTIGSCNVSNNTNIIDDKSHLQKLLLLGTDSVNTPNGGVKRSAPTPIKEEDDDSVEVKWKEIEEFIHHDEESESKTRDAARPPREKRKRFDSGSSFTASMDDSDDDSSDEDWSDGDIDMTSLNSTSVLDDGKKGEKYFWQYNVQSKGPKGTKLKLHLDAKNPYKLTTFEDPVFDPNNTKTGIRHGGKARKGDGNDIAPSPRKLYNLGTQIRKLNHMINEISSNNDQPAPIRNEQRKKKNKLASRACRLKKKAQHEANKVKLYGLEKEHSQLLEVIRTIRVDLKARALKFENGLEDTNNKENLISKLDSSIAKHLTSKIAGNSTVFVNTVIKTVENGDTTGGISGAKK